MRARRVVVAEVSSGESALNIVHTDADGYNASYFGTVTQAK